MTLVVVGNLDNFFEMKHICPECGTERYSGTSYGSTPTRESLVVGTWNHNCFECGYQPIHSCYVDEDNNMLTINEILGEKHEASRKTVNGAIKGNWDWKDKI